MGKPSFFLSYREGIYKQFAGLFGQPDDGYEEEPVEDVKGTSRRTLDDVRAEQEEERIRKWTWIGIIYSLCDGDITKSEQVVSKPFIECLVWMSYKKEMIDK